MRLGHDWQERVTALKRKLAGEKERSTFAPKFLAKQQPAEMLNAVLNEMLAA